MTEYNRFSEHYRIDEYLKNKSAQGAKSKPLKKNDNNILSNFPVGLIIIGKESLKFEDKIKYINKYTCKLFELKENPNIKELKEKFSNYMKLNDSTKTNKTLKDIIFNYSSFNYELENFVPFESTYSKSAILYIKINEVDNEKYIVIDKYDKYIEERKYIELNLIKAINYQYLQTLYHELNNPLNALLAISDENDKINIQSSDISCSKIENKPSIVHKKTIRLSSKKFHNAFTVDSKKEKNFGIISLNNRFGFSQDFLDYRQRKRTMVENVDLNNKIPLLVNIIKIFIKNFILYLKTKANNLLLLKNEFKIQSGVNSKLNEAEANEFEKALNKHKLVKINLEYIFSVYLEKFRCLFQYKEIEFETNFNKLRNIYVITDEFNFIFYIRQIYTYLYYIIPKKDGFIFEYQEEGDTIKIKIRKKNVGNKDELNLNEFFLKDNIDNRTDMSQIIQTKEMTKEVLFSLSKQLKFALEIYDKENDLNNNNILSIDMPIQKKDKSEEEDDFKDEDINEMVQNNTILLEDKLKRQFPIDESIEKKQSQFSNYEIILKNVKDNTENSLYLRKDTNLKIYSHNNLKLITKNSDKHLKNINLNNEKPKKIISSHKTNQNFLNKCLKISEYKKPEKYEKYKHVNRPRRGRSDNLLNLINLKSNIKSLNKRVSYGDIDKNLLLKRQKMSGIFTKINNLGLLEELDYNDISISNMNKKEKMNESQNISSNDKQIKERLNTINNIDINLKTKPSLLDLRNSKIKSTYITTEAMDGENKNINININNNNSIINIINDNSSQQNKTLSSFAINNNSNINNNKEQKRTYLGLNQPTMPQNIGNNYKLPELDKAHQKRYSQNISPQINPKDCMTFFSGGQKENVSKDNNTIINENLNQNEKLFLEANKERELYLEKSNKNLNVNSKLEEEEYEENEDNESENISSEEKNNCNCLDILIVDDEKFNVIATKKMLQKIGYESDDAYNGEECINLIKQKQKLNCKCNKNYYKIIFLDIVMPVLDGIKTAKIIQEMINKKEINNKIQIVFVSGNIDGNELKESLLKMDCVKECLQKPVRIDKYQKILEKYYKND